MTATAVIFFAIEPGLENEVLLIFVIGWQKNGAKYSKIKYNFKTILLLANYRFIGDEETAGSFYGQFGAGYVMANYKEDITGSYDKNVYKYPLDQVEKTKENGFTINLGLGGEYKIGTPAIFGEAGLALPANRVGNSYVENVIPAHFTVNLGIKIPLGYNSNY